MASNHSNFDELMQREYLTIAEACRVFGISQFALRNGCKDGTIPHLRIGGKKYLINAPMLRSNLRDAIKTNAEGVAL